MAEDSPMYKSIVEMRARIVYNLIKNAEVHEMEIAEYRRRFNKSISNKYTHGYNMAEGKIIGKIQKGYYNGTFVYEDYMKKKKYAVNKDGTLRPLPKW